MYSRLVESARVRLFQTKDAYSDFERIKVLYKTFRPSKEEKLYAKKRNSLNSFNA
jgi:hypothetical protein